jgi:carbohydrate-selective porin OprB
MVGRLGLMLALLFWVANSHAQERSSQPTNSAGDVNTIYTAASAAPQAPANLRPFRLTLPQDHLFGDWYGLRTKLEKLGIDLNLTYVSDVAGNPSGGQEPGDYSC